MNAPNDNTAPKDLRGGCWASPRDPAWLIVPWEYRHLRASGVTRIAGGSVWPSAATFSRQRDPHRSRRTARRPSTNRCPRHVRRQRTNRRLGAALCAMAAVARRRQICLLGRSC